MAPSSSSMPREAPATPQAACPPYEEVISCRGIDIPFVPSIITPKIERPMRKGRYESGECALLEDILREDDRVLDLGAGVGLVSAIAARTASAGHVTAVEANPRLIGLIGETWALNGVTNATLLNAVVSGGKRKSKAKFYLRRDFWASSMEPDSRPYEDVAEVETIPITRLMKETRSTVICCDIEGGELGLFDEVDLSGVRQVVVELHPKVYGEEGAARVRAALEKAGLKAVPQKKPSSVVVFAREGAEAWALAPSATPPSPPHRPARPALRRAATEPWPPRNPRILLATCMKDEGPFILEWLAWHKAIGVTDVVVYTNDCSDGTDRILDRLQEMGELTHLPNPALATGATNFQPVALAYTEHLRAFREADFFISSDVDEFFNIRVGEGRFADLFAAVDRFDVMSVSEINHGCNRREHFEPGWVTEQFPGHASEMPGRRRAHVGVKSIVRLSPAVRKIRNHRPDLDPDWPDPVWLDGSGRPIRDFLEDPEKNGCDCRGRYGLVSLEHFALRSLDSYLIKMFRGDVVVKGKRVGQRYWRQRNWNAETTSDLSRGIRLARDYHRRFEEDHELMALHRAACDAHLARAEALMELPEFRERRAWALREAWR